MPGPPSDDGAAGRARLPDPHDRKALVRAGELLADLSPSLA